MRYKVPKSTKIVLWVGVVTSDIKNITNFLISFEKHQIEQLDIIESLKFLILINDADTKKYQPLTTKHNLDILDFTNKDIFRGEFKKLTIAEARTSIHRQLYKRTNNKSNTFSWVADDDLEIDSRFGDYIQWLPKFKEASIDAVISPCDGEPANCFYSGIRCQLFDFFENFKWLTSLTPQQLLPNRCSENKLLRKRFPEYYYDLTSLHKEHLKKPYWIEPLSRTETVAQALNRLKEYRLILLEGRSPFRQVRIELYDNPLENSKKAINKGGNAFIINPKMLLTPNITIKISGKDIRRSDMVWSLINTTYYNYKIVSTHFPVIHNGSRIEQTSANKMVSEVISTCFIHTLRDHIHTKEDWKRMLNNHNHLKKIYLSKLNNRLNNFSINIDWIYIILEQMKKFEELQSFTFKFLNQFSPIFYKIKQGIKKNMITLDLSTFFEQVQKEIIMRQKKYEDQVAIQLETISLKGHKLWQTIINNIKIISSKPLGEMNNASNLCIRIHSSCFFSEQIDTLDCDCVDQLKSSIWYIANISDGIVFYLEQEARGHGIKEKLNILKTMQESNLDTYSACDKLKLQHDIRSYQEIIEILKNLNISSVTLISNNPLKKEALTKKKIDVPQLVYLPTTVRKENVDYLKSKQIKGNHRLNIQFQKNTNKTLYFYDPNGKNGYLSNLSQYGFKLGGVHWLSVEHFYKSHKYVNPEINTYKNLEELDKNEFQYQPRRDWEYIKQAVMYTGLFHKFHQNPELKRRLIDTKEYYLAEESLKDYYWGIGKDGRGNNYLGKLLMQLREQL